MILNIMGFEWLVFLAEAHSPDLMVDGTARRGACWCGHQRIALSNELTRASALMTIRHEVAHAVIWSTQASTPENYTEEDLCNFMALWAPTVLQATNMILDFFWPVKIEVENKEEVVVDA